MYSSLFHEHAFDIMVSCARLQSTNSEGLLPHLIELFSATALLPGSQAARQGSALFGRNSYGSAHISFNEGFLCCRPVTAEERAAAQGTLHRECLLLKLMMSNACLAHKLVRSCSIPHDSSKEVFIVYRGISRCQLQGSSDSTILGFCFPLSTTVFRLRTTCSFIQVIDEPFR